MTDAEKAMLKEKAHEFFDKDVPALIDIEEARLPVMYQGMVKMIVAAVLPAMIQAMDAKVDAFVGPGV